MSNKNSNNSQNNGGSSCSGLKMDFQQQKQQKLLALFTILRHYWRMKTPLDEALAKIRQTEQDEAEFLTEKLARKWFGQFEQGVQSLAETIENGLLEDEEEEAKKNVLEREQIEEVATVEEKESFDCHRVPTETWVDVFSYLGPAHFLRLEWVNAHWLSIFETFFWPKVKRLNLHVLEEKELRALIARYGSQIRDIFIGPTLDHKDLPIHEIIRDLPMLERIRVGHKCIANDVDSIATLFPNIKYTDLDLNYENYDGLPAILHKCQQLESLELAFTNSNWRLPWSLKREFDLRVSVNALPKQLKYLRAYDCGHFMPHLLEMAARDCANSLRVLITGFFFETSFESSEAVEILDKFKNLRYLQTGIDLYMLKAFIREHPEVFKPLRGFAIGYFDNELLSLVRKNCSNLEHIGVCLVVSGTGRTTYRTMGYFVKQMPKLRALDVRDTLENNHKWRVDCARKLAKYGSESIEFLNLMIDFPFDVFLALVKNFKRLQCVNCFTIADFSLKPLADVLEQDGRTLRIAIINKRDFKEKFQHMECSEFITFQKHSIENRVEYETKKFDY